MKSKVLSIRQLKEEARAQIWIPVMIGLSLFILQTMGIMTSFERWDEEQYRLSMIQKLCLQMWNEENMFRVYYFSYAVGIFLGFYSWYYLHSSKKVDFIHSLPQRRETIYIRNILLQIRNYVIPCIIVSFMSVCACALQGEFSFEILRMSTHCFFFQLLAFVAGYAYTSLAVVLTGKLLHAVLGCAILFSYGYILKLILQGYMSLFLKNYISLSSHMQAFLREGNPIESGLFHMNGLQSNGLWSGISLYILKVIIILAIVFILFKERPSEAAGKSLAFPKMWKIIIFLVEIPMILGAGLVFQFMVYGGKEGKNWWLFGLVIGAVITHCVTEIIYTFDYKNCIADKKLFLMVCALSTILVAIMRFDVFHYDTNVPDENKIQEIAIEMTDLSREYGIPLYDDSTGKEKSYYTMYQTNQEIYQAVKAIAKGNHGESDTQIKIGYQMKNGDFKERIYGVTPELAQGLMEALVEREEYKECRIPDAERKREYLISMWFHLNGDHQYYYSEKKKLLEKFYDALLMDLDQADKSVYLEYPIGVVELQYEYSENTEPIYLYENEGEKKNIYDYVYIYPGFKNVVSLMEKENMQKYYHVSAIDHIILVENDNKEDKVEVVYDKPEQIRKIIPRLLNKDGWCAWLTYASDLYAIVAMEDDEGGKEEQICMVYGEGLPDLLEGGNIVHKEDVSEEDKK